MALADSGFSPSSVTYGSIGGSVGAVFATITFLPQGYISIKSRSVKDISLPTFIFSAVGNVGWLMLGVEAWSLPLIISGVLIIGTLTPLLYLKLTEHKREKAIIASKISLNKL